MLVTGDRYLWFGEHKLPGEAGNVAEVGVHVYSSPDLLTWTDEGTALSVSDDIASPIARGCILERPTVVHCPGTGEYVMWFHLEPLGHGYSAAQCGVAVSREPTGPYEFITAMRPDVGAWPRETPESARRPLDADEQALVNRIAFEGGPVEAFPADLLLRRDVGTGQMARDLTVFVDHDERAYLISSSEENGTLHISELTDDYRSTTGKFTRVFPGGFNEAPVMFRRGDRYHLITSGCTGWEPNAARHAIAPSIWGPWTAIGNPCRGSGAERTFESQGTDVIRVIGREDAYVFMADRWMPENAIDGGYVWIPIEFDEHGMPVLRGPIPID
jgi:hypothetical protein